MNIIRLSAADSKSRLMDELWAIYSEALVPSEQKTRPVLEGMLANNNYYFYVLNTGQCTVGLAITYSPDYSDYCLLEYIAVDAAVRSEGYGGKLIAAMMEIFQDKSMVIEIDSPYQLSDDSAIRQKRMGFYMRHGSLYVEGLTYFLPLETKNIPEMILMLRSKTYNDTIPKEKLKSWLTDIYVAVYGKKESDPRINQMVVGLPDEVRLLGR